MFFINLSARLLQFGKEDELWGERGIGTNRAFEHFTARTNGPHDSTVQTLCTVQTMKKDFDRPWFLFVFQMRLPATSNKWISIFRFGKRCLKNETQILHLFFLFVTRYDILCFWLLSQIAYFKKHLQFCLNYFITNLIVFIIMNYVTVLFFGKTKKKISIVVHKFTKSWRNISNWIAKKSLVIE